MLLSRLGPGGQGVGGWGGVEGLITFCCLAFLQQRLNATRFSFWSNLQHTLDATIFLSQVTSKRVMVRSLSSQATSNTLLMLRSFHSEATSNTLLTLKSYLSQVTFKTLLYCKYHANREYPKKTGFYQPFGVLHLGTVLGIHLELPGDQDPDLDSDDPSGFGEESGSFMGFNGCLMGMMWFLMGIGDTWWYSGWFFGILEQLRDVVYPVAFSLFMDGFSAAGAGFRNHLQKKGENHGNISIHWMYYNHLQPTLITNNMMFDIYIYINNYIYIYNII